MKRHIARAAGLAAAALVGAAGCQQKQPQNVQHANAQPTQPLVEPQATTKPAPPSPETADAQAGTPEALKYKMQTWAREMQPLMDKRVRRGDPSDVEFLDPDALRLGPAELPAATAKKPEPPVQIVPIVDPVQGQGTSVSNQGVELANAEPRRGGASGANVNRVDADGAGGGGSAAGTGDRITATPLKTNALAAGDLEMSLNNNLRDHAKDAWAHLDYQLLQFVKDKPTPQLDAMARLAAEDRELLTAVMDALTNLRNGLRADGNMLMSRKVRPLLDLADRVRAQADLVIPTLALCTKVDGFGVYEPIDPARFTAMKEHPVIVYCEVENFASHLNAKKQWETKLSQEVVLYTESGLPVWQDKTESIPDLARNRRHDFFVVKKTKFPANITIGRYLLKVTIVDQQANRVAEATVPVQFVAQ
jgi:hypothetical protein